MSKKKIARAVEHFKAGHYSQSIEICQSCLAKGQSDILLYRLMADNLFALNDHGSARPFLEKLINIESGNAQYYYMAGIAYSSQGDDKSAISMYQSACELDPDHVQAHSRLSGLLGRYGHYHAAIEHGERAVKLDPADLTAMLNLAMSYDAVNDMKKAHVSYGRCVSMPMGRNSSIILCKYADSLISLNERDRAEQFYLRSIQSDPAYTHAHRQLSRLKKYKESSDPLIREIEELLEQQRIPANRRSNLHFALGKMYEDVGDYERSFMHYEYGNDIESSAVEYDLDLFLSSTDLILETAQSVDYTVTRSGVETDQPVFIVGMPRSGTTLVEQILAAHPDCFGAGELYWFGQIEQSVEDSSDGTMRYPEIMAADCTVISPLAENYIRYINTLADRPGYARITDKLPGNFIHIGLIMRMFSDPKIVHCVRDPMDTCFSIYSILFPGNVPFGHRFEDIAAVYRQYEKMMMRWKDMFPGKILDVKYEDMVMDQEKSTRDLLRHVGLGWDERCIRFYDNDSSVKTISAFQVRDKIYDSSIGRWKNYRRHLSGLASLLRSDSQSRE